MKLSFLSVVLVAAFAMISLVNSMSIQTSNLGLTKQTVYLNNYDKAQTDYNMYKTVLGIGSVGKFYNEPNITQITSSTQYQVVRMNCDTLYSYAVFDLTWPVTIELPANDNYYMSLYAIDNYQYSLAVVYPDSSTTTSVTFTYINSSNSADSSATNVVVSDTRYIYTLIRTLADPFNATDLARANALQNAVKVTQADKGVFIAPLWDNVSLSEMSTVAASLADYLEPNTQVLGYEDQISEVAHLVGTASGWGGLPNSYATYELLYPPSNDSSLVFQIQVTSVPIYPSGFWSLTVYNANGYLEYNDYNSYSLNSLTAQAESDGTYLIYFSAIKQDYMTNWIYIYPGWNYMVRLYEPTDDIINGSWTFPSMTQVV